MPDLPQKCGGSAGGRSLAPLRKPLILTVIAVFTVTLILLDEGQAAGWGMLGFFGYLVFGDS